MNKSKECTQYRYTYFGGLMIDHKKKKAVNPDGSMRDLKQKERKFLRSICK